MRLNKDNVINSFCIFVLVTTMCVIITIVLKLFFGQKIEIGFVKDIFSIGSTLAAALIAVALFSNWKDQAKHSLSRQNIEDILQTFSIAKKKLRFGITVLRDMNEIDNYAIFKERYKNLDFTEDSNILTQLDFRFKILDSLDNDNFKFFEIFAEIDRHFVEINYLFIELSSIYTNYYHILKEELKLIPTTRFLDWNQNTQGRMYDQLGVNIEKLAFDYKKLKNLSSRETGYIVILDEQNTPYIFKNPNKMIMNCIKLIEQIENKIILDILPKD